ncbi:MAG TPA: cytochrome P450 [Galbitalea sp.]|jgi:cytochrome P450
MTEVADVPSVIEYPSQEIARCPFPHLAEILKGPRVYEVPGRSPREFVVSHRADVVEVLKQPNLFSSQGVILEYDGRVRAGTLEDVKRERLCTFQTSDPPKHTVKRKLAFEYLKPGKVKSYEGDLERIADGLIDGFHDSGRVEFMTVFAKRFTALAALTFLGMPVEDVDSVMTWVDYDGQGTRYQSVERQQRISALLKDAVAYTQNLVRSRYESPRSGVLDEYIASHVATFGVEEGLDNARVDLISMLLGAVSTTAHTMASVLDILLDRPADMARVRTDSKALSHAIEEGLRVRAPIQWQNRLVTEDTELAEVAIPAGSILVLGYQSAGLDAEHFGDDAAEFDIDRRNTRSHMSFGYGIHSCVGAPFARLMAVAGFQRFFARCDNLRRAENAPPSEPIDSIIFYAAKELRVEFDPV